MSTEAPIVGTPHIYKKDKKMKRSLWISAVLVSMLTLSDSAHAAEYILNPTDDIFISGQSLDSIYNNDSLHATNYAYHETSLLRFDLSSVLDSDQVISANLYLYELNNGYYDRAEIISVFLAEHDNWNELSAFASIPDRHGSEISQESFPGDWYNWMSWDLSQHSFSSDLADNSLTLILESVQGGSWNMTRWASTEYADQSLIPYLAITTDGAVPVPEPGTIILLGSGLVGLAGYGRKLREKT